MSLMSRKVDYALLILAYLDQKREGACSREIADRYGLNRGFVANILKDLCRKGFVASHRGVKGGYALLRPTDEVNLAELMDSLDETFYLAECSQSAHGGECSLTSVCPVKGAIAEVHSRIRAVLRGVTLAEVFRTRDDSSPLTLGLNLVLPENLVATP
jgi:Rrf2 family cysteine metabolism transcriptional repressor